MAGKINRVAKKSGQPKPDSFGKYVFAGAKKCRICPWAADCKEASKKSTK